MILIFDMTIFNEYPIFNAKKHFFMFFISFLFLIFPTLTHAAISVNSTASQAFSNSASTYTLSNYSVTNTGTNRLLLVAVSFQNRNDEVVTGITYNNIALSKAVISRSGNDSRAEIWSLVEQDGLAIGSANNIVVTLNQNSNQGVVIGAVSFSGINEDLPFGSTATSIGNSEYLSLAVPSAQNEVVFAIATQEDETVNLVQDPNPNPDTNYVQHWSLRTTTGRESLGAGATHITPNGVSSITMGWSNIGNPNDWAMAGVSIKPALAGGDKSTCVIFKDTFTNAVYNNNSDNSGGTPTVTWASDWTETNDDASATTGIIQITGGELRLDGNATTTSIQRGIDLSTYDQASLSFDYYNSENWENADTFNVNVSTTATPAYSTLTSFTNDQTPSFHTKDISSYLTANFKLQLASGASATNERFYIDNVQIKACASPPTIKNTSVACPNLNQVTITFSKNIDYTTAIDKNNYFLSDDATPATAISISSVSVSGDKATLTTTSPLTSGTKYTVKLTGIKDLADGSTSGFTAPSCVDLIALYQFDEISWSGGGTTDVIDQKGAYNGERVGAATVPIDTGKICHAAYIPRNVNITDQNAIDTKVNVTSVLGDTGSINFWYKSDVAWVGGGNRVIIDASTDTANTFALILQDNGSLRFQLRDTATNRYRATSQIFTSYSSTDWVHIAVTWDLPNDNIKLYVNGVLEDTDTNGTTNGIATGLSTLYFGDNRTTTFAPLGATNSAGGVIDEAYIYNTVRTISEIQSEMGNSHTCSTVICGYRDDFATTVYSNRDGSSQWSSDWLNAVTSSGTPDSNYVSLTNNSLVLQNNLASANRPGVERSFSLLGVTNPTNIYYTYTLSAGVDSADSATVEIHDGTSWRTIETITGLTAGTYTKNILFSSIAGPPSKTSTMKIALRINDAASYTAANESISFLYFDIRSVDICNINPLDHIQFRYDGAGLTCEPEKIYVKACTTPDCTSASSPAVTLNIDTSTTGTSGPWTNLVNALSIPANTETPVTLAIKTPGVSYIRASTISPAPSDASNPYVCKNINSGASIPDCNIEFYDSGFIFTTPVHTSCKATTDSDYVPVKIRAVRKDQITEKCVSLFDNATAKSINFTMSSLITTPVVMNDQATPFNFDSANTTHTVSLPFTNSEASFTLKHNNAGKYGVTATHSDSGLTVSGSTSLIVKPYDFLLEAKTTGEITLNNATASGDPKWKASDNFRLRLRGQCQNGTITTNYTPTNAELQVELALPASGTNKNLTLQSTNYLSTATASPAWYNISSKFSSGAVTDSTNNYADAAFHEVGVLKLHVRDTNYFGTTIAEQTQTVGRFIPHHFDTTLTPGCSAGTNPYTYSGQAFSVVATARNNISPSATTTQNYSGAFAYDTTLTNAAVGDSANFNGTNIIPKASFQNGSNSLAAKSVTYTYPVKKTVAADITLRANDADTATAVGLIEGKTNIRSGRMVLNNVFGPVSTDLTMLVSSEYYSDFATPADTSDDDFILNTDDSCSGYDATGGSLVNYTDNLTAGDTSVSGAGTLSAGEGLITFTAPGNGNDGKVNLFLNNVDAWLLYNAGIDCDNADSDNNRNTGTDAGACGTATFGIYRGDDRTIYWREIFK